MNKAQTTVSFSTIAANGLAVYLSTRFGLGPETAAAVVTALSAIAQYALHKLQG